jgi:hypothetical protein
MPGTAQTLRLAGRFPMVVRPVPVRWYGGPIVRFSPRWQTILEKTEMAAILILAISVVALLRFAIYQWRMIWLTTANQPLSDSLRAATGVDGEFIGATDFSALLGLCDELTPDLKGSTPWLREVRCYYHVLAKLEKAFRSVQPALSAWAAAEMKTCSRYVAVVLDQHLSVDLDRRAAIRSS